MPRTDASVEGDRREYADVQKERKERNRKENTNRTSRNFQLFIIQHENVPPPPQNKNRAYY
jgi:hypothetical protein